MHGTPLRYWPSPPVTRPARSGRFLPLRMRIANSDTSSVRIASVSKKFYGVASTRAASTGSRLRSASGWAPRVCRRKIRGSHGRSIQSSRRRASIPICFPILAGLCQTTSFPRFWAFQRSGFRTRTEPAPSMPRTNTCLEASLVRRCRSWPAYSGISGSRHPPSEIDAGKEHVSTGHKTPIFNALVIVS